MSADVKPIPKVGLSGTVKFETFPKCHTGITDPDYSRYKSNTFLPVCQEKACLKHVASSIFGKTVENNLKREKNGC
jgi:hypothetical protein